MAQVSTSDLRGMLPHHFELLRLPVAEFLARGLGAWEPPPTALTQSYGVKSPRRHTREVQLATCSMQVRGAGWARQHAVPAALVPCNRTE